MNTLNLQIFIKITIKNYFQNSLDAQLGERAQPTTLRAKI
ncbi:hypothetical protein PROVRUST_07129 [Providencia rustigianii DSM 4541]|uniref:Uncharacterized protein n=1 Tax=Providencia rustigianii DSM 4541 TaxID=500637 RepID=D1P4H7_9GAMM|nr:hypothetical protein PROVRUST_07129 [Providencia rustigianii DSM 4541]